MSQSHKKSRVLLKLSGAFFQGHLDFGFDFPEIKKLAESIVNSCSSCELALVIGGGNLFRGAPATSYGVERASADSAGMLATVMNALIFQSFLEDAGRETRVMTAVEMRQLAEPFIRRRALRHLQKGRIVILACGTGNPYFTTDSAAALRAAELKCESLMKATSVNGVYTDDPKKNPNAKHISSLGYRDFLTEDYGVMDSAAISICRDNSIPVRVFSIFEKNSLKRAIAGENIGTLIK